MLVTGASGFVGSLLLPRLLAAGHHARALAREPERAREALEPHVDPEDVEIVRGDALRGEGLDRALGGVEVAYYLIHSMERTPQGRVPFAERERLAADNFAAAARRAGVRRIVYLGGLVPAWPAPGAPNGAGARADAGAGPADAGAGRMMAPLPATPTGAASRHLASRREVERILMSAVPDSVALRASIVVGARSRSFRLLVRLIERMPVLALPAWREHLTAPIDQRDVIEVLLAGATAPVGGLTLDAVGPDVLSYGEILERIAEAMLVHRPALHLRVTLTSVTARIAAAVAGEDPELVLPLMEGLAGDLLPRAGHDAAQRLGVRLHGFDAAVGRALADWEQLEPLAAR